MICDNCGGELKLKSNEGGVKVYNCVCCGSTKEVEDAPKVAITPVNHTSSGEDVFEANIASAVELYCDLGGGAVSSGSGYIISTNGKIITNAHVVSNPNNNYLPVNNIMVRLMGKSYPATVVAMGDNKGGNGDGVDLAIVKINEMFLTTKPVKFADSMSVKNGMKVFAIGNSLGQGTCITTGIVSDKARVLHDGKTYIMTDCAINAGNSGGPLFNESGEVIGSVVAGITNAEGMNFAIPCGIVQNFIERNN